MQRQQQQQQSSRIDLADMKGEIIKRIGLERSRQYFYYLSRLLTQKLSKNEFDKLCTRVIGKENLSLHNRLIRSILKNACDGKVPPTSRVAGGPAAKSVVDDGFKQSSNAGLAQGLPWSNGVVSPKKSRSSIRDRKLKNQHGLIGSNGKLDNAPHLAAATNDSNGMIIIKENGNHRVLSNDYQRPVQLSRGFSEPALREHEASIFQPRERIGLQGSTDAEDESCRGGSSRFTLHAPLGIPFCRYSLGGSHKPFPAAGVSSSVGSCSGSCSLPDTESLQKIMEQIAVSQGLEGVSLECANILNSGLDMYLKRLITSCVSLVGGKSGIGSSSRKQNFQKQQIQSKVLNGLLPNSHHYMQNNGGPAVLLPEHTSFYSMSMLDFKVAMELNPRRLGEDWPLLLEKINMNQFSE